MVDRPGAIYVFPDLSECREAFAKKLQQKCEWNDQRAWTVEASPDGSEPNKGKKPEEEEEPEEDGLMH
jgi:hypothetical protein